MVKKLIVKSLKTFKILFVLVIILSAFNADRIFAEANVIYHNDYLNKVFDANENLYKSIDLKQGVKKTEFRVFRYGLVKAIFFENNDVGFNINTGEYTKLDLSLYNFKYDIWTDYKFRVINIDTRQVYFEMENEDFDMEDLMKLEINFEKNSNIRFEFFVTSSRFDFYIIDSRFH